MSTHNIVGCEAGEPFSPAHGSIVMLARPVRGRALPVLIAFAAGLAAAVAFALLIGASR
jgi:hypothetical protein